MPIPATYRAYATALIYRWFSIDLRTLALMRVLMAALLMVNVAIYWSHAEVFISDQGIFPTLLVQWARPESYWSLYYLSGEVWWAVVLFCLTMLSAFLLMIGYRTRLFAFVCWVLVVSLSNRFTIFASGADMQYCSVFFWLLFLPMGARFSVDAALSRQPVVQNRYLSIPTAGLLLQVTYLYLIGALLKTGEHWQQTHEAIYYALQSAHITTPLAAYLVEWPEVMRVLSVVVLYLELYVVFLLFLPFWALQARVLALGLLVMMHLGFALFLSIGLFPLVSITALMCFLPGEFWDGLLPRWNSRPSRRGIAIYYDEACDFCRKICLIFRELGLPPETPVAPAQADAALGALLKKENSWIVQTHDGRLLLHWEAVAYVWRRSPLFWPLGWLFWLPFMRPVGRGFYRCIATYRGLLARFSARLLPYREASPVYRPSRLTQAGVAVMVGIVLLWNLQQVYQRDWINGPLQEVIRFTRLSQTWNMFAPQPSEWSQWTVIEGHLADGRVIDLFRERMEPPSYAKPAHGWEAYPDFRWRKYFSRFGRDHHVPLGEYYCKGWAGLEDLPSPLRRVIVWRFLQPIRPYGEPSEPPVQQQLMSYPCRPDVPARQ